jgi:hypothetical protein
LRKTPKLFAKALAGLLARGLGALAAGALVGTILLLLYLIFFPIPGTLPIAGGALVLLPLAIAVAVPVVMIIGILPMYALAAVLQLSFRLVRIRHLPTRAVVSAVAGGAAGHALLNTNLAYWGSAVPGALYGGAIMLSWELVAPATRRLLE